MTKIILKLFILMTLCVALFTHTTPSTHAQTSDTFNLLGHFGGAVFVDGNTTYIGMGGALVIMDVSDPANPTLIGKSDPLPSIIQDIEVVGSVA